MIPIAIPESAYPYLVAQRGALDDMKEDPDLWCSKYAETLASDYEKIEPFLPEECETVLDVGGGMGGINILLNEHYGGDLQVTLLDGVSDPPVVTKHAETFSNFDIARQFLHTNGIKRVTALHPRSVLVAPHFFDLVISLKSWCFHYEPSRYLEFVRANVIPGKTKIILDIRGGLKGCPLGYDWYRQLTAAFKHPRTIHMGGKFETVCFTA